MNDLRNSIRMNGKWLLTVVFTVVFALLYLGWVNAQWFPFSQWPLGEGDNAQQLPAILLPPQLVLLSGYLLSVILCVILGSIILGQKRRVNRSLFQEEQYQAILEHANDGMLITRQGVVCYANAKGPNLSVILQTR